MTSYDVIPYESLPVSYTYLPHLGALGRLFGLQTTDAERCRVLEMGCAEGNNIIPMAWQWPDSEFVGIDLSKVQIEKGQELIETLHLPNIKLYVQDIADLNAKQFDKFDYIILHGVFSWISAESQQIVLATAQSLLTENGIIYISYNTYPGWHAQMVLRDALLLYCSDTKDPIKKVNKIPEAIHFFKKFFQTTDNEFSKYNTMRLSTIEKHSTQYLYHEFLEADNNPIYFSDFIKLANRHGLQYLSDALLAFDNTQLLGKKRNAMLDKIKGRVKRLQYMDFMVNQRFRRTLLCHQNQKLRSTFSPEHMMGLAYRGKLKCKRPPSFNSQKTCHFYQGEDKATFITLSHPVSKAAVQILTEHFPSSMDYMNLIQRSCQLVADNKGLDFVRNITPFYQELYLLLINDWISMDTSEKVIKKIKWDHPVYISDLTWEYAKTFRFIPTFMQQAIDINKLNMMVLQFLNKGIIKQDLLKKIVQLKPIDNGDKKHFWSRNPINELEKKVNVFLDVLEKNNLLKQKL